MANGNANTTVNFTADIKNVKQWSAEHPNLDTSIKTDFHSIEIKNVLLLYRPISGYKVLYPFIRKTLKAGLFKRKGFFKLIN